MENNKNNEKKLYTVFGNDSSNRLVCATFEASSYQEMEEIWEQKYPDGDIATYVDEPVDDSDQD